MGLGDRHLQNLLLDEKGALVHIDMGYAFGTGALLPVPELVPFRLTRELCAPLEPVGAGALLPGLLEAGLAAARAPRARAGLLGLLETFVRGGPASLFLCVVVSSSVCCDESSTPAARARRGSVSLPTPCPIRLR